MRILIIFCLLLCAGCSQTGLLTRQDYQKSQQAFMRGDEKDALRNFPRGAEHGDFITTMERGYLSLIRGKPQIAGLQRQERLQRHVPRHSASRDVRMFLQVRKSADYRPAAYELIWMHLLLGWGYADQGKYGAAAREARLAAAMLRPPVHSHTHFDDPMLRLLLAGLWTMCGQWDQARVDLLAASTLDNSLGWAGELASRERPPAQLLIVMGGPGPKLVWHPALGTNPLRAARRLKFVLRGRKSALSVQDADGKAIATHLSPDARRWYADDRPRKSETEKLLQDWSYGGQVTAAGIKGALLVAGQAVGGAVLGTAAGAVLGPLSLLYGGHPATGDPNGTFASDVVQTSAEWAVVGGVVGAGYGIGKGYQAGAAEVGKAANPANIYRYVRYLPEYLWIGWTDHPVSYPVTLRTPLQKREIHHPTVANGTAVTLAHLSDRDASLCTYTSYDGAVTTMAPPDDSGNCPPQPNL